MLLVHFGISNDTEVKCNLTEWDPGQKIFVVGREIRKRPELGVNRKADLNPL